MNLLWSNQRGPVPGDEDSVRTTVTTVEDDEPATQEHSPDWNETFTDPDTGGGLTSRQVSSHVVPMQRFVPAVDQSAMDEHNAIINRQVSTSGAAAAKEASGEWGHGSLQITEGIEPTIVDGQQMGYDYFVTHPRPDAHAGNYMTPAMTADPMSESGAQAMGTRGSRHAVQDSMYAAFYRGVQDGL